MGERAEANKGRRAIEIAQGCLEALAALPDSKLAAICDGLQRVADDLNEGLSYLSEGE